MRTGVADKHRRCRLLGTIAARRGATQDDTAASARRAGRAVTDRHTAAPPRLERSSGTLPPGIRPATHEPATLSSRDHTAWCTCFAPLFLLHCLNRFMQYRRPLISSQCISAIRLKFTAWKLLSDCTKSMRMISILIYPNITCNVRSLTLVFICFSLLSRKWLCLPFALWIVIQYVNIVICRTSLDLVIRYL